MTQTLYTLVFSGNVARGRTASEVRSRLIEILPEVMGKDVAEAFKGHDLVLTNLVRDQALRVVTSFEEAGALCRIDLQAGLATPGRTAASATTEIGVPRSPHSLSPPDSPPGLSDLLGHDPRTTLPGDTADLPEAVTCPKCDTVQTAGPQCRTCGVLFDKIDTVTRLADDPYKIPREIAEGYRPLMDYPGICLTPIIPAETAATVLGPYLDPQVPWENGEEFIINPDEELIATFNPTDPDEPCRSNFVLTNLKFLVYRSNHQPICAGFDLWTIHDLCLVGPRENHLQVNTRFLQLPALTDGPDASRKGFIRLVSDIVRSLRQADKAARLKAKRSWRANPYGGSGGGSTNDGPMRDRVTLASLGLQPAPGDEHATSRHDTIARRA